MATSIVQKEKLIGVHLAESRFAIEVEAMALLDKWAPPNKQRTGSA